MHHRYQVHLADNSYGEQSYTVRVATSAFTETATCSTQSQMQIWRLLIVVLLATFAYSS